VPLINIEYDDNKVDESKARVLSEAVQKIVSEATGIKDVFVYANTAKVRVEIAPIEIFVRMSDTKIEDLEALTTKIKDKISEWKKETDFKASINLTVIPMHWKIEIGI